MYSNLYPINITP